MLINDRTLRKSIYSTYYYNLYSKNIFQKFIATRVPINRSLKIFVHFLDVTQPSFIDLPINRKVLDRQEYLLLFLNFLHHFNKNIVKWQFQRAKKERYESSNEQFSNAINNFSTALNNLTNILSDTLDKLEDAYKKLETLTNSLTQKISEISKIEPSSSYFPITPESYIEYKKIIDLIDKDSYSFILKKAKKNEFLMPILDEVIDKLNILLKKLKKEKKVTNWNFIIKYNPENLDFERIIIWIQGDFHFSSDEERETFEDEIIEKEIEKIIQDFKKKNPKESEKIDYVNVLLSVFLR